MTRSNSPRQEKEEEKGNRKKNWEKVPDQPGLACQARADAVLSPLGRGRREPEGIEGKLAACSCPDDTYRDRACVAGERGNATVFPHRVEG